MNLNFRNGTPVATPRTPSIIPSGKFEGCQISELDSDDLRSLQGYFFRRDAAVQNAIAQELFRRRPVRRVRGPAGVSTLGHRPERAQARDQTESGTLGRAVVHRPFFLNQTNGGDHGR